MSAWILAAAACLAGYLLGAIPSGVIIGRLMGGIDVREHGSGVVGATNTFRTLGWKASVCVLVADLAKAVVAIQVARSLNLSPWVVSAVAVLVIAGHCWSVYIGWRGGRGVACSLSSLVIFEPMVAILSLAVFVAVLARWRLVSLASLTGSGIAYLVSVALIASGYLPPPLLLFSTGAIFIIFIRHRDNIMRIVAGTERKLGQSAGGAGRKAVT